MKENKPCILGVAKEALAPAAPPAIHEQELAFEQKRFGEERNCRCCSTLTVLRVPTGAPKPTPVSPREGSTDGLTALARAFAR